MFLQYVYFILKNNIEHLNPHKKMNIDHNIKKYLILIKYNGENSEIKNGTCSADANTI